MPLLLWMYARCHGSSAPRYTHFPSRNIRLDCISDLWFRFLREESDWSLTVSCLLMVQSVMARSTWSHSTTWLGPFPLWWWMGAALKKGADAYLVQGLLSWLDVCKRALRTINIKCCINMSWQGGVLGVLESALPWRAVGEIILLWEGISVLLEAEELFVGKSWSRDWRKWTGLAWSIAWVKLRL